MELIWRLSKCRTRLQFLWAWPVLGVVRHWWKWNWSWAPFFRPSDLHFRSLIWTLAKILEISKGHGQGLELCIPEMGTRNFQWEMVNEMVAGRMIYNMHFGKKEEVGIMLILEPACRVLQKWGAWHWRLIRLSFFNALEGLKIGL